MIINNIKEFCDLWGVDEDTLEHAVYKGTSCGAYIHWNNKSLTIGSIVEGSDAEFSREFQFPCDLEDIEEWFEELEDLTDQAWREANCTPYRIYLDGYDHGIYYGENKEDALDQLAKSAGYKNWKHICEECPDPDPDHVQKIQVIDATWEKDVDEDTPYPYPYPHERKYYSYPHERKLDADDEG